VDLGQRAGLGEDVQGFLQRFQVVGGQHHCHWLAMPGDGDALMGALHLGDQLGEVIACVAY
jgi:hypothetical protein